MCMRRVKNEILWLARMESMKIMETIGILENKKGIISTL